MNRHAFLLVILVFAISCEDQRDFQQCSQSIEESKQNGVFVREYEAPGGCWKINDTIEVRIKRVWLENHWRFDHNYHPFPTGGYQMILETNKKDINGHDMSWRVGIDGFAYWRKCSQSALITDIPSLPAADSVLTWEVQKGFALSEYAEHQIIGSVSLSAKK